MGINWNPGSLTLAFLNYPKFYLNFAPFFSFEYFSVKYAEIIILLDLSLIKPKSTDFSKTSSTALSKDFY